MTLHASLLWDMLKVSVLIVIINDVCMRTWCACATCKGGHTCGRARRWVKAHETCPICREPLVAQPAPAAPAHVDRYAPGRHEQELMFRLLRIQRRATKLRLWRALLRNQSKVYIVPSFFQMICLPS